MLFNSMLLVRSMLRTLLKCRVVLIAIVVVALFTIGALHFRSNGVVTKEKDSEKERWVAWEERSSAAGYLSIDDITGAGCTHGMSKSAVCSSALSKVPYFDMYNAVEDAKLQLYTAQEGHKIKAVIYYLANTEGLPALLKSIMLLYKNFNQKHRYPVVIFHEADFLPMAESVRHLGFIQQTKASSIFFQHVDLTVPGWFLKKFGEPPDPNQGCAAERDVGYRSMCRFQAKLIYEQKILRHFDYYWRLDDDSHLTSEILVDVFSVLKTGGFSYGFYLTNIDDCAHILYNVTENYMKLNGITPTFFPRLKLNEIFFNNFEVSSLPFWRSQMYRDFIEHIDSLGGIYLHRWGDAPIKTLALSMFVPLRELYRYTNISYDHPVQQKFISHFSTEN